ncbi:MAG: hypothetical protein NT062_07645, partial [Proteobacteria bacterium]|nr:hypothetical protein [Pseudomonadota bacterium]
VADACRRLFANDGDAEVALGRYTVAHRVRALAVFRGAKLVGAAMHRRLSKRLAVKNLAVRVSGPTGTTARQAGGLRAFARFVRPLSAR